MSVSAMRERGKGRRAGCAPRADAAATPWPHGRPELDDDLIGFYMDDAASRGGYRKALDYYRSGEARSSEPDMHRLRAQAWLCGRLGRYDLMGGWIEEAGACGEFDHILGPRPAEARRNTGRLLTVGPPDAPAAPSPDVYRAPDTVWRTMLILDATGPVFSRAGLGAAAFLAGAGIDRRLYGRLRGRMRYNPRRGAGLEGMPWGCLRWIIADTNPEPRPANSIHYYYDLTDEGRRALEPIKASDAPWPRAAAAAAADLAGMKIPDMLEAACDTCSGLPSLDRMRGELDRLAGAWLGRRYVRAGSAGPPCPGDAALAGLGPARRWLDDGHEGLGSASDRVSYLNAVTRAVHAIAFESAAPPAAADAVLRTLIEAIRILCRRHARTLAAAAPRVRIRTTSPGGSILSQEEKLRMWPWLADETPSMISDLYYCLAEYCRSRGLARDPFAVPPPSWVLAKKGAAWEARSRRDPSVPAAETDADAPAGRATMPGTDPHGAVAQCPS